MSSDENVYTFSILIPTYNNLPHLELLMKSIQKNSAYRHQLIVIVNEGNDGTLEWIKKQVDTDVIHCPTNSGVCVALNAARSFVKTDYIVYLNDDMYVLPGWDEAFSREINKIGNNYFFLSGTMIEHTDTNNKCVLVADYGKEISTFRENDLLNDKAKFNKSDWFGSTWPPNILHREVWDLVGGYSIEFSPGLYSDPDLSMKLWLAGVREFRGIGDSLVYHFGSKTVKRVTHNKGALLFFLKWGMTSGSFTKNILKRGEKHTDIPLSGLEKQENVLKNITKRIGAITKFKGAYFNEFWNRFK